MGERIYIDMPEMSCVGWARVVGIEPCPPIESGRGRIVTATFHHSAGAVYNLHLEGIDEPIGVTAMHPFWSVDRETWVPLRHLRSGEMLRTLEGLAHVKAIVPRGPPEQTFNIEIAVTHTYLIAYDGVLVHNASKDLCKGLTGPGAFFKDKTRSQVETALEGKYGPPRSVRPEAKTYYNPKSKRSYNVHEEAGHMDGKPHVDIRKRGDYPERKYLIGEE